MLNITLTDEQVISLFHQLPKEKKKELLEHLRFEEWLESEEALKLKREPEIDINENRTYTVDEARNLLIKHGKDI